MACNGNIPSPTQPTAESTILLAEPTDTTTPTLTPIPTNTAVPTPTLPPTDTPEPSPTPTIPPTPVPLTIEQPASYATVVAGNELEVSGHLQPDTADFLNITLVIAAKQIFTGTASVANGVWHTTLPIPTSVTGQGQLTVQNPTNSETAQVDVVLLPDPDDSGITLDRPYDGETAVSGYTLFLEGRVRQPVNDTITLSVSIDNCTTYIAAQNLTVSGGAWYAALVLPPQFIGPACVVVTTGEPKTAEWREARTLITILPPEEAGQLLVMGNPLGTAFQTGQTATIYGVAVNALNNQVRVVVALDDGQRTLLASDLATVGAFGYWEVALPLPANYSGFALIIVSTGEGDTYTELTTTTTITP